jgi:HxlR-like helix-turn-helix
MPSLQLGCHLEFGEARQGHGWDQDRVQPQIGISPQVRPTENRPERQNALRTPSKLEAEEILERNVYAETPVRIEYQLTAKGLSLRTVLVALGKWAIKWDGR